MERISPMTMRRVTAIAVLAGAALLGAGVVVGASAAEETRRWTTLDGAPLTPLPLEFRTRDPLIPAARSRYLADIASTVGGKAPPAFASDVRDWIDRRTGSRARKTRVSSTPG